jgi:hypothetical protein
MADKLVTIAKFTDYSEADLARQLLDDFGKGPSGCRTKKIIMADKLITIAKFTDYSEADLARQLLDDFGIKSVVIGEKFGLPYPKHRKSWNLTRDRGNNTEGMNWLTTA